ALHELHSLPTRRSSDLVGDGAHRPAVVEDHHRSQQAAAFVQNGGSRILDMNPDPARPLEDELHLAAAGVVLGEYLVQGAGDDVRSEEHTSELQSRENLV